MENTTELMGRILRGRPSPGTLLLVLQELKAEGRSGEVIRQCLRALDRYPDDIRIRDLLAETYLDAGFISRAEAELDRITRAVDELIPVYRKKAELYVRQNRHEEAEALLGRYLAHFPDDPRAVDLLAKIQPEGEAAVPETDPVPETGPSETLEPVAEAGAPVEKAEGVEPAEEAEAPPPLPPETPVTPEAAAGSGPVEEETGTVPSAVETEAPEPPPTGEEEIAAAGEPPEAPLEEEPAPEPATDMATPTLAEIYYGQGQMEEAVRVYETVVRDRPDDMESARRLAEIRAELSGTPEPAETHEDTYRDRTLEMICVLENWLDRIREADHA